MPTVSEQVNRQYKTRIFLASGLDQGTIAEIRNLENDGLTIEGETVYIDPTKYGRSSQDAVMLARILGIDMSEISDALILRVNRNVDIVEKLSLELSEHVKNTIALEQEQVRNGIMEIGSAIYPFLKLEDHPVRIYPE